ncbi:hypothetical protein [Microcystis aeruginosa]|nr:hypothetical protein [Microcystis aeruginosa]
MRSYSVDFRQKIIDVWKKEKISIRGLAQRLALLDLVGKMYSKIHSS